VLNSGEFWGYSAADTNSVDSIPQNIFHWTTGDYGLHGTKDATGKKVGFYYGSGASNWTYGLGSSWDNAMDVAVQKAFTTEDAFNYLTAKHGDIFSEKGGKLGFLPQAASGGYLAGPSHAQGGIPIEAEGGEYVIRKSAVDSLGIPYLNYLNEEGGLPFMRFGMGEFLKQDQEVGMAEVNSSDGELKTLIRELIQAIKDGDKDIAEAIEELEINPDINVYTDLEGEVKAQLYAYDEKIKEGNKRGLTRR